MANENYLHPSVNSTVNSYQNTYQSSSGVVTLFQADVFEKGKDGVVDFVGSEEEFIFKYGKPNYEKYGQAAYNIVQWLRSGGEALVLRVLPEDATYAHSVLNIQSKVRENEKSIINSNNDVIQTDDIELRPTVAFLKKNNRNTDELLNELNIDRSEEDTIDGYENNFLLLVSPKGRGESYNNLGFRLSLNVSMDPSYRYRVYDFEVVEFDEFNNINVVEGPFQVSFDPDSESNFGESMYIDEVIKRHSRYVDATFNIENFEKLVGKINPHVNPASIDIITGRSKVGIDGQPETFYYPVTGKDEDTHVLLQTYNSAGEVVTRNGSPVLNIPELNDSVQNALIRLDNDVRENGYLVESNKLSRMREQFKTLRSDNFNEFISVLNNIVVLDGSGEDMTSGNLHTLLTDHLAESDKEAEGYDGPVTDYDKFLEAVAEYADTGSEEDLNNALNASNNIARILKNDLIDYGTELYAALDLVRRSTVDNTIVPQYLSNLKVMNRFLNERDQISIFATEHKNELFDITSEIASYRIGVASGSNIEGITYVLSKLETEIRYIHENLLPAAYGSYDEVPDDILDEFDQNIEDSVYSNYLKNVVLLSDMRTGLVEDNAANREEVFASSQEDANKLIDIINKAVYFSAKNNMLEAVDFTKGTLSKDIVAFRVEIDNMLDLDSNYDEKALLDNARDNVELALSEVSRTGSKYFNTNMVDFSRPVRFLFGSDGSFTLSHNVSRNERRHNIKRELVKAYSGMIDADIINTKKYPFSVVLDARYPNEVKNTISNLAANNRRDFLFLADTVNDTNFPIGPENALQWRKEEFSNSSEYTSIFSQDLTYFDEFTGRDIKVTPTYVLASKIPAQATNSGLHYPLAGPRRGLVTGHKNLSWSPSPAYKEKLYMNKINYLEQETNRTKIGSQLTSLAADGPLSNLNNMFTLISIKRDVEELVSDYQFEFNDDETREIMYTELNAYLDKYVGNRSCETITADVSSSEYDKQRRIVRVKVTVKFNNVIERIYIDIDVQK